MTRICLPGFQGQGTVRYVHAKLVISLLFLAATGGQVSAEFISSHDFRDSHSVDTSSEQPKDTNHFRSSGDDVPFPVIQEVICEYSSDGGKPVPEIRVREKVSGEGLGGFGAASSGSGSAPPPLLLCSKPETPRPELAGFLFLEQNRDRPAAFLADIFHPPRA